MAFTWQTKIVKSKGAKLSAFEEVVAQYLFDLQANADFSDLKNLHISAAKEVQTADKGAVVIFWPYRLFKDVRKIQAPLIEALEGKLGKHVFFLAQRRVLPKPAKTGNVKSFQKRPRSRALTAVHDAILDDLVFPAEVSGRRTRVKVDGSKTYKVFLDSREPIEQRLDAFNSVYKKLTTKDAAFIISKSPDNKAEAN